jgi:hypothetical protein
MPFPAGGILRPTGRENIFCCRLAFASSKKSIFLDQPISPSFTGHKPALGFELSALSF